MQRGSVEAKKLSEQHIRHSNGLQNMLDKQLLPETLLSYLLQQPSLYRDMESTRTLVALIAYRCHLRLASESAAP